MDRKHLQNGISLLFISVAIVLTIQSAFLWGRKEEIESTIQERPITLSETDFNDVRDSLPSLRRDTVLKRKYQIVNKGADTLKVLFVSPDCNCTGYSLSSGYAVPNDSVELELEIDMRMKNVGKYMLNTVIGMNTEKRFYRIKLEGEVLP